MRGISTDKFGTQAEMSCFPFGVTAAADASGEKGDRALLDSFMLKNVVFAKARFQNDHADLTKTKERLSLFGEKAVGIKVYFDTNMSDITSVAPLSEVCEFAHARALRVMAHCANSPVKMAEMLETLGKGDILTHSFHGGKNTAAEDNFESMREAQKRGVIIDVGFAGIQIPEIAVIGHAVCDRLRRVDCGAAADRKQEIEVVFTAQTDAFVDKVAARIGLDAAQFHMRNAGCVQRLQHLREQAAAHDAAAAVNDQRAAAAEFLNERADLGLCIASEDEFRRRTEFKIQHRKNLLESIL